MRSQHTRLSCLFLATLGMMAMFAAPAAATLPQWLAEVAAGAPAGYTNTNIVAPIVADIGAYDETTNGGVTYEFIVNATNDGASSALMGTFENPPPVGERAGIKWEQFDNLGTYGTTIFGVADFDSTVPNTPGVDTHVVFVNTGTDTDLYVNGAFADSFDGTPELSGTVGIGQVYNPGGTNFDLLTGTIIGVAVYDSALSGNEIGAHARAYAAIPEPATAVLAAVALASLGLFARRR